MAIHTLDALGLKCPQPTLKITSLSIKMKPGEVLEVTADCPTFEKDVKNWCSRF
ncbi:MAG: sulfurtransferase TusA family protein [Desulfobacterales bacterium]|nr:sulfurtransferase TusA family protein [Desulfobacterales bacterium]